MARVHPGVDLKTLEELKKSYRWYTEIPAHTWIQLFGFSPESTNESYAQQIIDLYQADDPESTQCKLYNTYRLVEYVHNGDNGNPIFNQGAPLTQILWVCITDKIIENKAYHTEHSSDHEDFINDIGTNVLQNNTVKPQKLLTEITEYFKHARDKKKLCDEYTQASDADKLALYFGNSPVELGMITTRFHIEDRLRFFLYLCMYEKTNTIEYFDFDSRENLSFVNMKNYTSTHLNFKRVDVSVFCYDICQKEIKHLISSYVDLIQECDRADVTENVNINEVIQTWETTFYEKVNNQALCMIIVMVVLKYYIITNTNENTCFSDITRYYNSLINKTENEVYVAENIEFVRVLAKVTEAYSIPADAVHKLKKLFLDGDNMSIFLNTQN